MKTEKLLSTPGNEPGTSVSIGEHSTLLPPPLPIIAFIIAQDCSKLHRLNRLTISPVFITNKCQDSKPCSPTGPHPKTISTIPSPTLSIFKRLINAFNFNERTAFDNLTTVIVNENFGCLVAALAKARIQDLVRYLWEWLRLRSMETHGAGNLVCYFFCYSCGILVEAIHCYKYTKWNRLYSTGNEGSIVSCII